jgi:hypothetical protein
MEMETRKGILMASKTLNQFIKKLPFLNNRIQQKVIKDWDVNTLVTVGKAKNKVPLASGSYMNSLQRLKARITKDGLKSFIVSDLPYGIILETGERKGKAINLKPVGEISQVLKGVKITKARKGEIGAIGNAIDSNERLFIKGISKIIGEVWRKF